MSEVVKIERLRVADKRSEWYVELDDGKFLILKRSGDETISGLCGEIDKLPEVSLMGLRALHMTV